MITEVLTPEEFTPQAVSYLLNATYFKGAWAAKFDKAETVEEVLSTLGMTDAFDAKKADFSRFCNTSTFIDQMKQVARIVVDEKGSEQSTGAILFIGQYFAE